MLAHAPSLADTARDVARGVSDSSQLHAALLSAVVFCERGQQPGFRALGVQGSGVVPVFSSVEQLALARGAVPWFSMTGSDLLDQLPGGLRRGPRHRRAHPAAVVPGGLDHPRRRLARIGAGLMMLRVDPSALTATAGPLREVSDVSRAVDGARPGLTAQLEQVGSDPVRRSAESFLDAWAVGLRGVAGLADSLAATLHTAATAYDEAEVRLRGHLTGGPDGGPA